MMCTSIMAPVMAQKTVVGPGETETATATIRRIDLAKRFVLLRDASGSEMGVFVPTEFTRINELKVGDTVTFTYYESIVYRISRQRASKPPVSEEVAATESTSSSELSRFKPSGRTSMCMRRPSSANTRHIGWASPVGARGPRSPG